MLELSIARDAAAPSVPGPDEAGVESWRHHDGRLIAYGGATAGRYWMRLVDVGVFSFGPTDEAVAAYPDRAADDELVRDGFRRMVLPMALQALGTEVLHASAVRNDEDVVALSAVSETGKSTLAFGLTRRGYELWADDAVAFEPRDADVAALPLPFTLRLRPESAAYFGNGDIGLVSPSPATLATVCVLERDARAASIERLEPADAFPVALSHAYCFSLADPDRKQRMMETYLELVTRVPVLRVRVAPGLERLAALLEELDQAIRAATAVDA